MPRKRILPRGPPTADNRWPDRSRGTLLKLRGRESGFPEPPARENAVTPHTGPQGAALARPLDVPADRNDGEAHVLSEFVPQPREPGLPPEPSEWERLMTGYTQSLDWCDPDQARERVVVTCLCAGVRPAGDLKAFRHAPDPIDYLCAWAVALEHTDHAMYGKVCGVLNSLGWGIELLNLQANGAAAGTHAAATPIYSANQRAYCWSICFGFRPNLFLRLSRCCMGVFGCSIFLFF